ncbi:MAG: hypothetical protein ICV51_20150 [Flavisolibacter sp.]|nr:hypothetical protein [Flavisolibacter sp.]
MPQPQSRFPYARLTFTLNRYPYTSPHALPVRLPHGLSKTTSLWTGVEVPFSFVFNFDSSICVLAMILAIVIIYRLFLKITGKRAIAHDHRAA